MFWSSQTFQGETDGVSKTLHRWVPPICHQPTLQYDMQPLFICKPEGILTVMVLGKVLRNQLGLQKWNTLIPGTFAHAMALNVKESKAFDSPSPLTQSLRQIMFYCNIKKAHHWKRREVVTWNKLFFFFENCGVTLCHIMPEEWEEHKTRRNPPLSVGRRGSILTWMRNESNLAQAFFCTWLWG